MTYSATIQLVNLFDESSSDGLLNQTISGSYYLTMAQEEDALERAIDAQLDYSTGYDKGVKAAEGGMSRIFKGRQRTLQRCVAIKENKVDHSKQNALLFYESLITARLEHPNIMPIYDLIEADGKYQVVLKWLEGQTLADKLEEWRDYEMEVEQSLPVLLKICDALDYAHSQGVIHRDIKPENIMIGDHGAIYLLDWGVALDSERRDRAEKVVVGTLCYMAPEMLTDTPHETVSERSDIFLMGATLHEVITGEKRHTASTPSLIIDQILESKPYQYDPEFQLLGEICNKACHVDPEQRYRSVRQFAHALQGALDIWKQRFLLEQGLAMLEELEAIQIGDFVPETTSHIFQLYMQTRAAFGGYLMLDSSNTVANQGLRKASIIMLHHCLKERELTSAKWMQETILDLPPELERAVMELEEEVLAAVEEDRIIKTLYGVTEDISVELTSVHERLKHLTANQRLYSMGFVIVLTLLGLILLSTLS
jgi:serine/threonine-protein kinase